MPYLSIHQWIHEKGFVNEKGEPIVFDDHMFLFEPYADFSRFQVYKKCSQVGVSVMMNLKSFYALSQYQWNIIYTLPADRDVYEFVPTKTDKLIQSNPDLQSALQTDKVELKQLFNRFLHFKGTRSKTAAIMTTADLLIHDEKDRSDLNVIGKYPSRLKKSVYKGIWELSNPSFKNSGVDVAWKKSDRKEWAVICPTCRHEQIMQWDKSVNFQKKIFVCIQCGNEITELSRRLGRWIASEPDSEISGYHISHFMAPWITAGDMIRDYEGSDEEYFHNFVLGEPIGIGEGEDFRQLIIDAWTPKDLHKPPYFMGVDIGGTKHYAIGNKDGIFQIGKCRTREEIELLIEHYNPTTVMDAGPERTWAEEFRKKYPKLWLNFYVRDKKRKERVKWGEDKDQGIVQSDRSRVIDLVVNNIATADIQFDLTPEDLEAYIKHWETMVKKQEIDAMGLVRYVWDKNSEAAQDHWVHATVYYYIARIRGLDAKVISDSLLNKTAGPGEIEQIDHGQFVIKDLKQAIEDKYAL